MPVPSPGREDEKKALSISVVPSRDGPRAACARPVDIAAQGDRYPLHIPPGRPRGCLLAVGRRHTRNGCCLNHRRGHCAGAMPSQAPQQVVKEQSMACSTITAALKTRKTKQNKRPGTLRCPGLCEESLEGNAPTRSLYPVANDPHRGHVRTNQLPDTAAGAGRHTVRPQRRARARGPVRVGGW